MLSILKTLSFSLVTEALTGLKYHRPLGENSNFQFTPFLMMREVSLETSPKNIMIQDMISSENCMNTTESKTVQESENSLTEFSDFGIILRDFNAFSFEINIF